jgi:tetratricopeptide (TPR) repeat protein
MDTPNRPGHSRLFLRLALAVAESKYPLSLLQRGLPAAAGRQHDGSNTSDREDGQKRPENLPEAAWQHLEDLRLRFESELTFADSCLEGDPPKPRVEMLLANSSELRRVAILQRLIERACSYRFDHPRLGLEIADDVIAWTKADPSPLVAVVRCRALMERGNLLRILGDPQGAQEALAEASRELDTNGTGDPLELARYQELLGTLERDCGNLAAASELLKKALTKIRKWGGDPYALQRTLNSAGVAELYHQNFEQAESLLDESMRVEEPDSLLLRFAAVNRIIAYFCSGNPHRAYQALLRVRAGLGESWLHGFPDRNQMWVWRTEGEILNALGIYDDGIGTLKKARELAVRSGYGHEVCHVSIDLAQSYTAQRRFNEARRELAFALPFCSQHKPLDAHAMEAVLRLQVALTNRGRLREGDFGRVSFQLGCLYRAPLQPVRQTPFADLPL